MTARPIKLLSPNNTPIVGALLEDGSICSLSVSYDAKTAVIDIILDHNGKSEFSKKDGEDIYIDESGHKWAAAAVIDHSIFCSHG